MQNSPIAMPASKVRQDDQPDDLMAFLQQMLLGGKGAEQIDPNTSALLQSLLSQSSNQGQTI